MREERHIDVSGGNVQIGMTGSNQYQYNFYGAEFVERIPDAAMAARSGQTTPHPEQNQTDERAERDKATIRHLMRHLNVPMMDDYLNREPSRVRDKIFAMHDAWEEIFRSSTFIIYDETMDRLVRDFYRAWHEVVVKSLPHEVLGQWEPLSRKFKAMMDCIKRKYVIDWDDVKIK